MTFAQINQGSGELEVYQDATKGITPVLADEAKEAEAFILGSLHATEVVYLHLGELLKEFRDRNYHKACGYDSFRQWANSAECSRLNYQTANNLIRIVEGLKPIFERGDLNIEDYPMSILRAMLPLVGDYTDDDIIQVARDARHLTVTDTNALVKTKRGIKLHPEPVVFKAVVKLGAADRDHHQFRVICIRDDGSYYEMGGNQAVHKRDYEALKKFYGRHLEEISA